MSNAAETVMLFVLLFVFVAGGLFVYGRR
jgi:cbb3-type cytochrome oxidase subunit 3